VALVVAPSTLLTLFIPPALYAVRFRSRIERVGWAESPHESVHG
jgi:hypothetical protein